MMVIECKCGEEVPFVTDADGDTAPLYEICDKCDRQWEMRIRCVMEPAGVVDDE